MELNDRTVVEAASWRLASELVRRHPKRTRLVRTHPGGGQYDVLQIVDPKDGPGAIMLNRNGTIQVHGRFDGAGAPPWDATEWADYVAADPREFLGRLESAAGLKAPGVTPRATPTTLTYRVLAAIAATAVKTVRPIEIEHGYIDTSGYGGGPNRLLDQFSVSAALTAARDDDLYAQPGYRFWIAMQEAEPIAAFEQTSGTAWIMDRADPVDLMSVYKSVGRDAVLVAAHVLLAARGAL